MWLFWVLLGIDGAAALVALYFFFVGLADGSVSSFNAGIWLLLLGGIGAVIGGGLALNACRPPPRRLRAARRSSPSRPSCPAC